MEFGATDVASHVGMGGVQLPSKSISRRAWSYGSERVGIRSGWIEIGQVLQFLANKWIVIWVHVTD